MSYFTTNEGDSFFLNLEPVDLGDDGTSDFSKEGATALDLIKSIPRMNQLTAEHLAAVELIHRSQL